MSPVAGRATSRRWIVAALAAAIALSALWVSPAAPETAAEGVTYYLSPTGDDAASGTSPATAWRTLNRIREVDLEPGSKILLEGGQTLPGTLVLTDEDTGTAADPIEIGSYGDGRATIQAPAWSGIWLKNVAGIHVTNLNVVGPGAHATSRSGITAVDDLPGNVKLQSITIDHVDVSGFAENGIGIIGRNGSGFRDVRITRVAVHGNLLTGIAVEEDFRAMVKGKPAPHGYSHENFYIAHARAYGNIGTRASEHHTGDGIMVSGLQHGVIEHSVAYDNGREGGGHSGGPMGIWAWQSDDIVIQHNRAYRNHALGVKDGGGFDLDGGTTNSVIQYNESYDNAGAGYLAFQFPYARPHEHNVIRFNTSRNDARKNGEGALFLSTGVRDMQVYGNRIEVGPRKSGHLAVAAVTEIPDTPLYHDYIQSLDSPVTHDVKIHDNVFVTRGPPVVRETGTHPGLLFDDNEYKSVGAPLRIVWKGKTYHSVAEWRDATGQEPVDGGSRLWLAALAALAALVVAVGFMRRRRRRDERESAAAEPDAGGSGRPGDDEEMLTPGRELWRYTIPKVIPYAKPYWKLSAASIASTIVGALVVIAQPWPIALVFDKVLQTNQGGSGFLGALADMFVDDGQRYWVLGFAIFCLFMLTVVEGSVTLLGTYIDTKLKLGMVLDFMSDLFEHFQRLGLTFHDATGKGALMNRVNNAPAGLGDFVAAAAPIAKSALTLLGMFIVAAIVDWQLALASLLIVPLLSYQVSLYSNRVIPQLRQTGQLEMRVMSLTLEAMQMLRLIVSFGRERHEYERFRSQARAANEARMKVTLKQTLFSLAVNAATAVGTALVLGLGAMHVIDGTITTGELVVLMTYIAAIYHPLSTLTTTVSSLNQQLVNLTFALEVLDEKPEIVEAPDATTLERVEGRVTFENVSFAYEGRKDTLRDISFDVQPGQRVAIVGQTGSGKSTLASLLIRFYDPKEGRILIDGHDTREVTLQSLRDQIAIVLQEPLLLSGSIGDNIRYGRLEADDNEVRAAAKAANVHEFIAQLPRRYQTVLGERGPQLSGGEQQRICVARAFLKDAPILLLDEPTSSIDSKTEAVIFEALEELMEGRTSFIITHRLSTIRNADLIVVMAEGRIVAQGTHDELYETSELYRDLYGVRAERALSAPAATNGHSNGGGHPPEPAVVVGSDGSLVNPDAAVVDGVIETPAVEPRRSRRVERRFEPAPEVRNGGEPLPALEDDEIDALAAAADKGPARPTPAFVTVVDEGWRSLRARLRHATNDEGERRR